MNTYYHINNSKECNWKTGDVIEFGLKENYLWKSFLEMGDYLELNEQRVSSDVIVRHALDIYMNKFSVPEAMRGYHFNPILTLKEASDSLGNLMRIVRELIFENVRKEFYPDLPSRHKCIWLIPDESESFDFWKSILDSKSHRIFKVGVNGKIHRASQKWLVGGTIPLSEIYNMAHKYWNGDDAGGFEDEVLFEGEITILEEINHQSVL